MNSNNSENYLLIDELFNLFSQKGFQEEDNELFHEWGINIDSIILKNLALFKQLNTQTKAELYEIKHTRVYEFLEKLKKGIDSKTEKFELVAQEIFSTLKFKEIQPMFRNLKDISEKDKNSILMDAKMLDLLSDLEKEFGEKIRNE
jgi:hypothetical protein